MFDSKLSVLSSLGIAFSVRASATSSNGAYRGAYGDSASKASNTSPRHRAT
jgi:hypothetical protein